MTSLRFVPTKFVFVVLQRLRSLVRRPKNTSYFSCLWCILRILCTKTDGYIVVYNVSIGSPRCIHRSWYKVFVPIKTLFKMLIHRFVSSNKVKKNFNLLRFVVPKLLFALAWATVRYVGHLQKHFRSYEEITYIGLIPGPNSIKSSCWRNLRIISV